MGWEHRGNSNYYYRKKRIGQRVISEYMGTGSLADLYSDMDTQFVLNGVSLESSRLSSGMEARNLEAELEHLDEIIYGLVWATLLVSGYRSHKGQWRKARHV